MDFSLTPDQEHIREATQKLCAQFDDAYWLERERKGGFPHELHAALAEAGWLGIAMPQEHGGAGLGITEAAVMMQAIAESGAAILRRLGRAHEHLRPAIRSSCSAPKSRSAACCRR